MPGPVFRRSESVALCTVEEEDLPYLQRLRTDPAVRWTTAFDSRPTWKETPARAMRSPS